MPDSSADEANDYDFSADPDGLTREAALGPDWLLDAVQSYIFGADDQNDAGSLTITLVVSGTVMRGMLVSRDTWLREQVATMPASAAPLGQFMDQVINTVRDKAKERRAKRRSEGRPVAAREFLHLKDATVSASVGSSISLPYCRVRVGSVDAWTLGS